MHHHWAPVTGTEIKAGRPGSVLRHALSEIQEQAAAQRIHITKAAAQHISSHSPPGPAATIRGGHVEKCATAGGAWHGLHSPRAGACGGAKPQPSPRTDHRDVFLAPTRAPRQAGAAPRLTAYGVPTPRHRAAPRPVRRSDVASRVPTPRASRRCSREGARGGWRRRHHTIAHPCSACERGID